MNTDVAIIGGGPGGSTAAIALAQQGIRSVIVEREEHPRFHIGESLTGEAGGLLRKLGLEDEMLRRKWPIKHGASVYGPTGRNNFWVPVKKRTPEGLEATTTWQVRRSDFDRMLWERASGVAEPMRGRAVAPLVERDGVVRGVRVALDGGRTEDLHAEVVLDASGMATFLASAGVTGPKERGEYDRQVAFFSHFKGAIRDPGDAAGNTLIFYRRPYHWGWFIPVDDEVTSIGVVVPSAYFRSCGESPEDFMTRELLEVNPELAARVQDVEQVEDVRSCSNYSYQIRQFTGRNYLAVGDAHRFVDPIFSFGVHLTMNEAMIAADHIAAFLDGRGRDAANPFAEYEAYVELGEDVVKDLIDTFWHHPFAFAFLIHRRFPDDMIDMFAGRLYQTEPSEGLKAMRRLLASTSTGAP